MTHSYHKGKGTAVQHWITAKTRNEDGWNHIFTSHANYMSGHTHIQGDTSIGFSQKPDQSSQDQNPGKGNIIALCLSFCAPYNWIIVLSSTFCPLAAWTTQRCCLVAFSSQCLYVRYILQHTSSLWFRMCFFPARLAGFKQASLSLHAPHGNSSLSGPKIFHVSLSGMTSFQEETWIIVGIHSQLGLECFCLFQWALEAMK